MKNAGLSSILIAMTLLTVVVIAEAQQPKKVPRIGYLSNFDPATDSARSEVIRLALRDLGYMKGKTLSSNGDLVREKSIASACSRPS